jgi:hypothetical protein
MCGFWMALRGQVVRLELHSLKSEADMFAGLTREEHDWTRRQLNEERAKDGLPPLPETAAEEFKLLVANIAKAWHWIFRRA